MLASEWSNLPTEQKQQYLDAAEQDRERYTREYNAYKQTEAYQLFTQQQNEKKSKENKDKEDLVKVPTPVSNIIAVKDYRTKFTYFFFFV